MHDYFRPADSAAPNYNSKCHNQGVPRQGKSHSHTARKVGLSADQSWFWPSHPQPRPGESFTSWLLRNSRANHFKLTTYLNAACGSKRLLKADMDRVPSIENFRDICFHAAQDEDRLSATTFRVLEGKLVERIALTTQSRWIIPMGNWRSGRGKSGSLYCRDCLIDDGEDPYYRLAWRYSFVTACDIHGTRLLDKCPFCLEPILIGKAESGKGYKTRVNLSPVTICHNCQADFRDAEDAERADPRSLRMQALLLGLICQNSVLLNGNHVKPLEFANICRQLLSILCTGSKTDLFRQAIADIAKVYAPKEPERFVLGFESYSIEDRANAVIMLDHLIQDWPCLLTSTAKLTRLSRSHFTRRLDVIPTWYSEVLTPLSTGHGRSKKVVPVVNNG